MKLRLVATFAVAASALLAAGCSSGPAAPSAPGSGTPGSAATIPLLTGGDVGAYATIDPNQTEACNDNYCGLFMEHLLQPGPDNTLQPELATSWAQTSPLTYVYHLRPGVRFWDGHPMTSADVVYSLDYQRGSTGVNGTSVFYTNVKNVAADGPYTVVVSLKQPDAGWKYTLSYEGVIFEKTFAQAHKGRLGSPGVLIEATGPWQITSYDPTRGMELTANPHWWGGKVPVGRISVKFYSSETSEALAMRAGEIDVAFPTNGKTFASGSGAHVTGWSPPSFHFFAMNTTMAPWSDVHVRRAVAYALNRSDIIAAYGGPVTASPASSLISPEELATIGTQSEVSTVLSSIPQYPYDLGKARQEMAQSAYPHGFTAATIIDNGGAGPNGPNVDQVIAAELHKIGITLKVSEVPASQYFSDYDNAPGGDLYAQFGAVSPDPSVFPSYCLGSAATLNVAHYVNRSITTLLANGLATSSPARRLAIYEQVLKQVATDVPYVVLFAPKAFTALSGKYTLPPFFVYPGFFSWALHLQPAA